jgi:hypothetical protein
MTEKPVIRIDERAFKEIHARSFGLGYNKGWKEHGEAVRKGIENLCEECEKCDWETEWVKYVLEILDKLEKK